MADSREYQSVRALREQQELASASPPDRCIVAVYFNNVPNPIETTVDGEAEETQEKLYYTIPDKNHKTIEIGNIILHTSQIRAITVR